MQVPMSMPAQEMSMKLCVSFPAVGKPSRSGWMAVTELLLGRRLVAIRYNGGWSEKWLRDRSRTFLSSLCLWSWFCDREVAHPTNTLLRNHGFGRSRLGHNNPSGTLEDIETLMRYGFREASPLRKRD